VDEVHVPVLLLERVDKTANGGVGLLERLKIVVFREPADQHRSDLECGDLVDWQGPELLAAALGDQHIVELELLVQRHAVRQFHAFGVRDQVCEDQAVRFVVEHLQPGLALAQAGSQLPVPVHFDQGLARLSVDHVVQEGLVGLLSRHAGQRLEQ